MNKGEKEIKTIDGIEYTYYFCNRCNVWIWEEEWSGDTHKDCDKWFKTKKIREKVHKRLLKTRRT